MAHVTYCTVDGCTRERVCKGLCDGHYNRLQRYGDVRPSEPLARRDQGTLTERFWKKVDKSDGCWEWNSTISGGGYGVLFGPRSAHISAHRFSWELHYGPIASGLFVCHRCDNRRCVRPDHLFLGTQKDNMSDASRKGRMPTGPRHPKYVRHLYEDDVLRLHSSGLSMPAIAKTLGCSATTVFNIVHSHERPKENP